MIEDIIKYDSLLEKMEKNLIEEKMKIEDYVTNDLVEISQDIYNVGKFKEIANKFDSLLDNMKIWFSEDLVNKLIPNINYVKNEQEFAISSSINSNVYFLKVS